MIYKEMMVQSMKYKYLILLSLVVVLVTGCGTFTFTADTVGAGEATATALSRQPTALPTLPTATAGATATTIVGEPTQLPTAPAEATIVATPTALPTAVAGDLLPAPLYYENPDDNQVWRVERDGVTLTQISQEAAPVEAYAVNPADGSLALVNANRVIVTDGLGADRRVIADAPSEAEAGVHWYLNARVSDPVWSADGRQLAYGLNGVNFYDVATDASRVVVPNDEMAAEGETVQRPVHVYTPRSFSPDGTFLLLSVGFYQSGGGSPAVLRLNTEAPPVELRGDGVPCCTFRWSRDGATIFSANDTFGMFQPGLWRSDAATGATEVVMASESGGDAVRVFNWPQEVGDGEIAVFIGEGERAVYEQGRPGPMRIATVDVEVGTVSGWLDGEWTPGEAVWLPDGAGVALTDAGEMSGDGATWPPVGAVRYVPLSGGPAVEVPVSAHNLAWGVSGG